MRIIESPSPNHSPRSAPTIDLLVIHSTEGLFPGCLEWMQNPAPGGDRRKAVSAHYLVTRKGDVHRLVSEARKAWHAGQSEWRGRGDVNQFSIGIELESPPDSTTEYTDAQYAALAELLEDIRSRRGPLPHVDHSAIAIPAGRKTCPEPDLDWSKVQEPAGSSDPWNQPVSTIALKGETVEGLLKRLVGGKAGS